MTEWLRGGLGRRRGDGAALGEAVDGDVVGGGVGINADARAFNLINTHGVAGKVAEVGLAVLHGDREERGVEVEVFREVEGNLPVPVGMGSENKVGEGGVDEGDIGVGAVVMDKVWPLRETLT